MIDAIDISFTATAALRPGRPPRGKAMLPLVYTHATVSQVRVVLGAPHAHWLQPVGTRICMLELSAASTLILSREAKTV